MYSHWGWGVDCASGYEMILCFKSIPIGVLLVADEVLYFILTTSLYQNIHLYTRLFVSGKIPLKENINCIKYNNIYILNKIKYYFDQ